MRRIEEFWSHSWHGEAWKKYLTLLVLKNGVPAVLLGTCCALLGLGLFLLGVLPRLTAQKHSLWGLLFGAVSSCGVLVACRAFQAKARPAGLRRAPTVTAYLQKSGFSSWRRALALAEVLAHAGVQVDRALARTVLGFCAKAGAWRRALSALREEPTDAKRASVGLTAFSAARRWAEALALFDALERTPAKSAEPGQRGACDEVCTHGAAACQAWVSALELLRRSWAARLRRDVVAHGSLISSGPWSQGLLWLHHMALSQIHSSRVARNAALAKSAESADLASAWQRALGLFEREPTPGEVTFRAIFDACEAAGEEQRALQLLWQAEDAGVVQSASFYLWAFARLVVEEPSVLHDAMAYALKKMRSRHLQPQELATLLWSCCMLGGGNAEFSRRIFQQAQHRLSAFAAADLLLLAWGAAGVEDLPLRRRLGEEAARRLQRWAPKSKPPEAAQEAEEMLGMVFACQDVAPGLEDAARGDLDFWKHHSSIGLA
ncbi:unnamed protein product [Effrenium voratum]|nr:unnamed protein product [Effrenium voratum]